MTSDLRFSAWEPLDRTGSAARLLTTVERDGNELGEVEVRVSYTALGTLKGGDPSVTEADVLEAAQAYAEEYLRQRLASGEEIGDSPIEIHSGNAELLLPYLGAGED